MISSGRTGYVALYRLKSGNARVEMDLPEFNGVAETNKMLSGEMAPASVTHSLTNRHAATRKVDAR